MNIAMYWHNGRSLGHTAEVAKISHAIQDNMPEANLAGLTGAYKGLDMLADKMDVVKLPGFANYDNKSGWNYMGVQGMSTKELFQCRADLSKCFIEYYKPDIFMVNHVPYGLFDELKPALELTKQGIRILTIRGILFDREKTNREYFIGEAAKWILDKYDALFVHIDPNIFRLEEHYDIPEELKNKIQYTGYLSKKSNLNREEARAILQIEKEKRIIVASMGGGQGAKDIWNNIIQGLKINKQTFDDAYLITGPYLETEDYLELKRLENEYDWIHIIKYVSNMQVWMAAGNLFIGAAGSSMIGEILSVGCNAILIPRQVREVEQSVHSNILCKKKITRLCSLLDVLDGKIGTVIAEGLSEPLSNSADILMDGSARYCKYLEKWYEKR